MMVRSMSKCINVDELIKAATFLIKSRQENALTFFLNTNKVISYFWFTIVYIVVLIESLLSCFLFYKILSPHMSQSLSSRPAYIFS